MGAESHAQAEDAPRPVPAPLAVQVELIATSLAGSADGATILHYVDAGLLNISESAQVDFELLNRILALRTAAERFSQMVDTADPDLEEARARALAELEGLEGLLAYARPSAMTQAMGLGW